MCDERLWGLVKANLPSSIELIHVAIPLCNSLDEMVTEILDSVPNEPINILGFSLGGCLVGELLRHSPKRIKRGMIISNMASALPESEKTQRKQALEWVMKSGYRGIPLKKAKLMLHPDHSEDQVMLDVIVQMDKALGEEAFISQLRATLERRDNIQAISDSKISCRLLLGLADQFLSESAFQSLRNVENVAVSVIAQSGHMLPLEQPKWVAKQIANTFC